MDIFVGSLSFKTTEDELRKAFEEFGEVASVKIILDQETRKSRGFAFVTMPNQNEANAAIASLNGREIGGFSIKVNEAKPREARSGPREGGGGGYGASRGSRPSFGGGGSSGGGYSKPWSNSDSSKDADIYDTKRSRSGGGPGGRKGRGGGHRGGGGSGGGGKRG